MALTIVSMNGNVELHGALDGAGDLDVLCGSEALSDYSYTLIVRVPTAVGVADVSLYDFSDGGTWTMSASHLDDNTPVTWDRDESPGRAYCRLSPTDDPLEIETEAAQSGQTTKRRKVYIKVQPDSSLPDHD